MTARCTSGRPIPHVLSYWGIEWLLTSTMLAERGLPNGSLDYWAVEPKLDGWRAALLVDNAHVVRIGRGHAITEMIAGLDALAQTGRRFLLDGELVAGPAGITTGRAGPPRKPLPGAASKRDELGSGPAKPALCDHYDF
jgi:hypothetical protein